MELGKVIQSFKSKSGKAVIFRYPTRDDFSAIWQYACDLADEDTYVEISSRPSEKEEREWFDTVLKDIAKDTAIYIHVWVDDHLVGSGRVSRGKYRHSHVGQMGISLAPQYRDEGIGTTLMKALIDEAKALGLRLLTLHCFENNPRALHIYEKLGFQRIGSIPGAIAFQGKFIGEIQMFLPLI